MSVSHETGHHAYPCGLESVVGASEVPETLLGRERGKSKELIDLMGFARDKKNNHWCAQKWQNNPAISGNRSSSEMMFHPRTSFS
ncbi:MAG: hypothetical protein C4B59_00310 [Candidatus Methanogaster sp.]|uniref:Uncharacterized protein n=1 Tax=Candidatus Methanogaster sp. TaxID=3386292 RepID=A0AC61L6W2_9EURY|nr:MAG: hypothetical protein C4B59_00310 [ANME-2 cluster archaeon]